jgi:MFS family permease
MSRALPAIATAKAALGELWNALEISMNEHTPAARPTKVRFLVLALLIAMCFTAQFNRMSISVAGAEKLIDEFGISDTKMGSVYSAYLLFYTLCMIPGGWFIDGRGAKFALATMVVCSVPLVFATGMVRPLAAAGMAVPALWLVRSLLGTITAPLHPGAARMVWSWTPVSRHNVGNGMVTAAALLAWASVYPLFGRMIDAFDWPVAFTICSVITAALALAWIICARDNPLRHPWVNAAERKLLIQVPAAATPTASETAVDGARHADEQADPVVGESKPGNGGRDGPSQPADAHWWTLLLNRSLIMLAFSYGAVGYFQYLFAFWIEHYLIKEMQVQTDRSRNYTAVCMLATAAGMFLGGGISDWLSRRFGPRIGRAILPIAGMFGGAVLLGVGMAATAPGWVVAWFATALGVLGLGEASFWTTAIDLGKHRGGFSAAIMNTGGNAGGVVAPVLTPFLAGIFGWPAAIGVAGVMCLLGATLWLFIDTRPNKATDIAGYDVAH